MKPIFSLVLASILIVASAPQVLAHRLNVYAWVEGGNVKVAAYYSRKSKPKNIPVYVYGPGGELMLEGKTDEEGAFSFRPTGICDLKIVVEAGDGHRAECNLTAADLEGVEIAAERGGAPGAAARTDDERAGDGFVIPVESNFPRIVLGLLIVIAISAGGYFLVRLAGRKRKDG